MPRITVKPGTAEAIVLSAIYEAAECRVAVPVDWLGVRSALVQDGRLSVAEANEARKELERGSLVLSGAEAVALCNIPGPQPMAVCVTEDGQRALRDLELALDSGQG